MNGNQQKAFEQINLHETNTDKGIIIKDNAGSAIRSKFSNRRVSGGESMLEEYYRYSTWHSNT
jgi:hypothetical protein